MNASLDKVQYEVDVKPEEMHDDSGGEETTIGASIITNSNLGVLSYEYSTIYPKTLF